MDRREALKKMAVGGATVVGASAIMTSPAFAFDAPIPATPTITVTGKNKALTVTVAGVTGTCPASANNTTASTNSDLSFTVTQGATTTNGGATGQTGSVFAASATLPVNLAIGHTVASSLQVTYTCTYVGGTKSTCVKYTQTSKVTSLAGGSGNANFDNPGVTPGACP